MEVAAPASEIENEFRKLVEAAFCLANLAVRRVDNEGIGKSFTLAREGSYVASLTFDEGPDGRAISVCERYFPVTAEAAEQGSPEMAIALPNDGQPPRYGDWDRAETGLGLVNGMKGRQAGTKDLTEMAPWLRVFIAQQSAGQTQ